MSLEKLEGGPKMAENEMAQTVTVNNFDKLIGKNGELAELRKEQVLAGAIGIIQRQYAGRGKMEAIAALLGKKMGEEFFVRLKSGAGDMCKFTNKGLFMLAINDRWVVNDRYLRRLLTGEAEIVEDEE
jgi:hypothetical protein